MEVSQNNSLPQPATDVSPKPLSKDEHINLAKDQYISFVALGGLIADTEGEKMAVKKSAQWFADQWGVERRTLYNWREIIPNFWDKVAERRREVGSKERVSNVWNGIYLKASAGNPEAAKLFLANFDDSFRMPMQEVKHEAGNSWAALMEKRQNDIINITPEPAPVHQPVNQIPEAEVIPSVGSPTTN